MALENYSEKESEDLNNTTKHHQHSAFPSLETRVWLAKFWESNIGFTMQYQSAVNAAPQAQFKDKYFRISCIN